MAVTAIETSDRNNRKIAFLTEHGVDPASCSLLAGDASFRKYWRIQHNGVQRVLMDAPPAHEDIVPFITVTSMLRDAGLHVPRIYEQDTRQGWIILEDLGDGLFARILSRRLQQEEIFYRTAIDNLLHLHQAPEDIYAKLAPYNHATYLREVALFTDWFLPQLIGMEKAKPLRGEYLALWQNLLESAPLQEDVLVHRDYHAENLLWMPEASGLHRVGMLDYQDALRGDAAYDLVSLLEDARRDVSSGLADEMLAYYIDASGEDEDSLRLRYQLLGAQRNSKIIGIFVRLAVRDNKPNYLSYLPRVWAHLERDMRHPALKPLRDWVYAHVPYKLRNLSVVDTSIGGLEV